MMNENLLRLFTEAKSLLVVIGKNAKLDGFCAGIALSIAALKEGKQVMVCSEGDTASLNTLPGGIKISKKLELGGNTLKVTFPYFDGAIDKVTYNITEDKFNLLIEPKVGTKPLSKEQVEFSYTGGTLDLVVVIEAQSLESLGDIYLQNSDVFVQDKIVNIDRRFDNKNFGAENLVDKQSSSTSEIVLNLLEGLHIDLNPDIATNLYVGIASSTNNFTSFSANAQTFSAISYLLKNGAKKINPNALKAGASQSMSLNAKNTNEEVFSPTAVFKAPKKEPEKPKKNFNNPLKPDIFPEI